MAKLGRPPREDAHLLLKMSLLLVQGLAKSIRGAARQVAAEAEGASRSAIIDRLRHAYSKNRADYERRATELLAAAAARRDRPRRVSATYSPATNPAKLEPNAATDYSSPVAKKLPD
jgi:hypothetical protein